MLKCLIAYFSQNQTTTRVAESIAAGLRRAGYITDLYNLRDEGYPDLSNYDLVGIGAPVYYYRPPFNVQQFIKGLPDLDKKKFFLFMLHGAYSWNAGDYIKQPLLRKDAEIIGYFQCRGAGYFLGYLKRGYLFSPTHPTVEELARAENFGFQVGNNESVYIEYEKAPTIYRIERMFTSKWLVQNVFYRFFKVRKQKCNKCGLCMKLCPTKNIRQNESGFPVWNCNCLLCAMCEMKCPRDAIKSPVDSFLFRPFLRYNIKSAVKDSSLNNARVIFQDGQIKTVMD